VGYLGAVLGCLGTAQRAQGEPRQGCPKQQESDKGTVREPPPPDPTRTNPATTPMANPMAERPAASTAITTTSTSYSGAPAPLAAGRRPACAMPHASPKSRPSKAPVRYRLQLCASSAVAQLYHKRASENCPINSWEFPESSLREKPLSARLPAPRIVT